MKNLFNKKFLGVLSAVTALQLFLVQAVVAAPQPLEFKHSTNLNDFEGSPFLEVMLKSGTGIKALLDDDYGDKYTFADWATVEQAIDNFDAKVVRKVMSGFGNSKAQMRKFVESVEGTTFKPTSLIGLIRDNYEGSGNIFALEHFFAMASGAGTLVVIDDENYYYNYGYKSGANPDEDVKSGRSYGASELHNANDASDVMYLNELDEMFSRGGPSVKIFYTTMMEFLTKTDISGFAKPGFNKYAKAALTDFIAIYTAELDRHIMVDLNPAKHPWENDLAEATFASIFSAATGQMLKGGELTEAPLRDFWAMSETGSGRSGIGIGRKDRRDLQKQIAAYERENNPELVEAVEEIIGSGGPGGDIFRGVMEYLNKKSTQRSVRKNADALTEAFVELLMQVQKDAEAIAETL